ncbi:MAG: hypothetical protein GY866_27440 [Proteobacteria bacterium]|nr:hypothetical protein [Pseudomonadota bacterium]
MNRLSVRDRVFAKRIMRQIPFLGITDRVLDKAGIACELSGHFEWYAFMVYDKSHLIVEDLEFIEQKNTTVSTRVLTENIIHLIQADRKMSGWMHSHHYLPIGTDFSSTDRLNSKMLTNQIGFQVALGKFGWRRYFGTGIFSLVVDRKCEFQAMLTCKIAKPDKTPEYMLIPYYKTHLLKGDGFDKEEFTRSLREILRESKHRSRPLIDVRGLKTLV